MKRYERWLRAIGVALAEGLAIGTVVWLWLVGRYTQLPMAIATVAIVLLPCVVERVLSCRIALPVYLYALFYAVGPMLGQCYAWYSRIGWWDKLLHISGGVMFALLGWYVCELLLSDSRHRRLFAALFALCFSIAVAAVWEFGEFAVDGLLGMDSQRDTIVTAIRSHYLDGGLGDVGVINGIQTVAVNGKVLPFRGYLDIGLIDSMWDMMLETLGAVVTVLLCLWDRGRHPLFVQVPDITKEE